jgi:hypothetical protein
MPTVNETRLAAYLAAEVSILQAQEASGLGRTHRMAQLADVRAQIDRLQQQVSREQRIAAGGTGLNYAVADLSGASVA